MFKCRLTLHILTKQRKSGVARGRRDSAPPTNLKPQQQPQPSTIPGQTKEEQEEMENSVPMLKSRDIAAKLLVARVRLRQCRTTYSSQLRTCMFQTNSDSCQPKVSKSEKNLSKPIKTRRVRIFDPKVADFDSKEGENNAVSNKSRRKTVFHFPDVKGRKKSQVTVVTSTTERKLSMQTDAGIPWGVNLKPVLISESKRKTSIIEDDNLQRVRRLSNFRKNSTSNVTPDGSGQKKFSISQPLLDKVVLITMLLKVPLYV